MDTRPLSQVKSPYPHSGVDPITQSVIASLVGLAFTIWPCDARDGCPRVLEIVLPRETSSHATVNKAISAGVLRTEGKMLHLAGWKKMKALARYFGDSRDSDGTRALRLPNKQSRESYWR